MTDTLRIKKILEPTAGNRWTIIFDEPVTEASLKSFGLKLPDNSEVVNGAIECLASFTVDDGSDVVTQIVLSLAQAQANNNKLKHLYYEI